MSFYGNRYYYTADTFARIVLQNLGLKNYSPPNQKNIPNEDKKEYLDAQSREAGVGIESGNYWINLIPRDDKQGFSIWHNKPAINGDVTQITTFEKSSNIPSVGTKKLAFDDCLKVPMIRYDETGHITETTSAMYYQLPSNPVEPLEIRMNKIDGLDTAGNVSEPSGGSLQKQLRDEMVELKSDINTDLTNTLNEITTIQTNISGIQTDLEGKLTDLNTAITDSKEALTKANSAANDVSLLVNTVLGLTQRVTDLENKHK